MPDGKAMTLHLSLTELIGIALGAPIGAAYAFSKHEERLNWDGGTPGEWEFLCYTDTDGTFGEWEA